MKNGTIQICHVPHVASEAWFNEIYNGLVDEQIDKIEEEMHIKIQIDFREFYKICNGINIFSDCLSISGLRFPNEGIGDGKAYHRACKGSYVLLLIKCTHLWILGLVGCILMLGYKLFSRNS